MDSTMTQKHVIRRTQVEFQKYLNGDLKFRTKVGMRLSRRQWKNHDSKNKSVGVNGLIRSSWSQQYDSVCAQPDHFVWMCLDKKVGG